jgi:protein TonB
VARERLAVVLDALFGQAEAALLGGSLDTAAAALASVRRADPESSRLAFLNAQLDRARAAAMAPRERAAEEPAARPVVESTARPPPAELESLLTIAAARMQRGQLIEPAGDSARDYIARAAQLSPADPGVAQARAALGTALVTAAGAAVKDGNVDAAGKLLDEARAYGVRSDLLALVDGELGAARAAQESQRRNAMFATARQRIEAGALIRPEGESALDQMLAVDAAFPGSVGVSSPWNELVRALAANAGAALDRGAVTEAEPWVAALERSGREPGTTAALRQRLATLRLRQQYLMSWAPASELALVSYTQPVYPREALRDNVDGWVDLEFIVDANGRPRELKAIGSQPSGRFERAAIDAVSQYRYEPFVRDGETYERLVRLRIRFTLQ